MIDELNDIFEAIKGWSVEQIQSILYHEKWTKNDISPFMFGKIPSLSPPKFETYREDLKRIFKKKPHEFGIEDKAKIIFCSTFLLMNDHEFVRDKKIKSLLSQTDVHNRLLKLFTKEVDSASNSSGEDIQKLQLFFALLKQRENPKFLIKKVTWKKVTSKWGPKIVMSNSQSYFYIFDEIKDFDTFQQNYNIAAALGRTEQYQSEYLEEKNNFGLSILKVDGTKNCMSLSEFFNEERMGREGNSSNPNILFERLAVEYFRNKLNIDLHVQSNELRKILPRLREEEDIHPCLNKILKPDKKWKILRTVVKVDKKEYFVVHGDEWGGNFLVAEAARQVYMIDFEDAIFADVNDGKVVGVGGDLSSRIFSASKNPEQEFLPIGLSLFASIGRTIAAIVQYHSRHEQLENTYIGNILSSYLDKFKTSLERFTKKEQHALVTNNWNSDFQPLILLHAWDWALYWHEKAAFPQKSFEVFVEEIKNLLCDGLEEKAHPTRSSTQHDSSKLDLKIRDIKSQYLDRNERMRKLEELLPLFPDEQITIKLEIIENSLHWEDARYHFDEINPKNCKPFEIVKFVMAMYKLGEYKKAKDFIIDNIRGINDANRRIDLCRFLEEINLQSLKSNYIEEDTSSYHRTLCEMYDVEYDSIYNPDFYFSPIKGDKELAKQDLERMIKPNSSKKEFEDLLSDLERISPSVLRKGDKELAKQDLERMIKPNSSKKEFEDLLSDLERISPSVLRQLGLYILGYLTQTDLLLNKDRDNVLSIGIGGDTVIEWLEWKFFPSMPKSIFDLAKEIIDYSHYFEDLYTKDGYLNLHLIHFNIVVVASSLLLHNESVPSKKRGLEKRILAYCKRSNDFKKTRFSTMEYEAYRQIVKALTNSRDYPLVSELRNIIKNLKKCESEQITFQFLAIVINIIQISQIFDLNQSKGGRGSRNQQMVAKEVSKILDFLETWIIEEPEKWGANAVIAADGDLRKRLGKTCLKQWKGEENCEDWQIFN